MVDRIKRRFDLDERREAPILLHRGIAAERLVEDRDLGLGGGGCFSHGCQGGCAGERARKKEPHIELMVNSSLTQRPCPRRVHSITSVPVITGIHSIVVTGEEVSVIFDIMPDTTGNGLHFEFEMAMITREELCRFGEWLAESSYGGTVHCVSRPCTGCARRPWGHF
jgi:hypothetical protein